MNKNDKVTITEGSGYDWNDNGIMKFRRATFALQGVVIDLLPKQQIYICLDDGRKVITGKQCIKVETKA